MEGQREGQKDRQTLFYWTLVAKARASKIRWTNLQRNCSRLSRMALTLSNIYDEAFCKRG